MAYHSSFGDKLDEGIEFACGCPCLPLKRTASGRGGDGGDVDIVDEAIMLFRANVLFRKFDIKSPADRLLLYLTLFINMALKRVDAVVGGAGLAAPSSSSAAAAFGEAEAEGTRTLINLGLEHFPIPGDDGFPLPGLFPAPLSKTEADALRAYLRVAREETSSRLLSRIFLPDGTPNKWWLCFAKRRFMNVMLPA